MKGLKIDGKTLARVAVAVVVADMIADRFLFKYGAEDPTGLIPVAATGTGRYIGTATTGALAGALLPLLGKVF